MFKKILIPLDGSAIATSVLPHGQFLATLTEAEVTLLNVLESETAAHVDPIDWHLRKVEASSYLQETSETLSETVPVQYVLLEGKPAERIIEYTQQNDIDLLVLCSHGRGGLNDWHISSLCQKIIQRIDKSVLLIRATPNMEIPEREITYKRILVPLDGSQRAESVLPLATKLAQQCDAELLLVHVVEQPNLLQRTPLTADDQHLLEQLTQRNQEEAEEYFDYLKSYLPLEVQTKVVISENVMNKLHEVVKNEAVDLVLFNAHGRSGIELWPYGSIVTNFIQHGTTSLLIVQDLSAHYQHYNTKTEKEAPELLINALRS